MKLRNKRTGEIINDGYVRETHDFQFDGQKHVLAVFKGNGHRPPERVSGAYNSLAELNEEWEDYKEPKQDSLSVMILTLTNFIENEPTDNIDLEDCKKMLEKLKAWERIKDKGFKVDLWDYDGGNYQERIKTGRILFRVKDYEENDKDLDLLFGGEE